MSYLKKRKQANQKRPQIPKWCQNQRGIGILEKKLGSASKWVKPWGEGVGRIGKFLGGAFKGTSIAKFGDELGGFGRFFGV